MTKAEMIAALEAKGYEDVEAGWNHTQAWISTRNDTIAYRIPRGDVVHEQDHFMWGAMADRLVPGIVGTASCLR